MAMNNEVVAVLDVGKTNKKVSLYDGDLQVVGEERTSFELLDYNGIEVEDTDGIMKWFYASLRSLARDHRIRAIAVTTHGATFTLLDETGRLAHPVISYTWAGGMQVQDEFYETFGDVKELHRKTGTPDIGFVNMAKVMFFVKTRLPDVWARCRHGLFYGPFFGHELTGRMGLEPTFPGNHTYFWNFAEKTWSEVARKLGADRLFGNELRHSWESLGRVKLEIARECGLPENCEVTLGVHDSNANFLPYLAKGYTDFLLNSTGTWCVLMRPSETPYLSDEEIALKVFFNQDVCARPVRTSLMTSGMDYDAFRALTERQDSAGADVVRRVVQEKKLFVVPGVLAEATAFPGVKPRVIEEGQVHLLEDLRGQGKPMTRLEQDYFAALNLGLAIATKKMLACCGIGNKTTVFIEGGFAKNRVYCEALAALCPDQSFVLTATKEGTAFGTALTGWMLARNESIDEVGKRFSIEQVPVARGDYGDLAAYEAAFLRHIA